MNKLAYLKNCTKYIFAEDGMKCDVFSYQLFHPDRKIITIKSSEEIKNCESEYIILPINLIEEWNVEKVLMETPNYILCRFIPEKNE